MSATLSDPVVISGYAREVADGTPDITADTGQSEGRTRRRRRRVAGFLAAILVPAGLMALYLYAFAADEYVSEFRFSVRHEAPLKLDVGGGTGSAASSGASAAAGAGAAMAVINDSEMVVQYLQSRQLIADMQAAGLDLDAIYARSGGDFWAYMRAAAPIEDRQMYLRRMLDPFFDLTTGIVSVEVRAFSPDDAKRVAALALTLCERLMNDISARAHADTVAYAERQLVDADAKMQSAQAASAAYRNRHAVLFPEMQATADSTVEATVRQGLIDAKASYAALLARGVSKDTAQMTLLRDRAAALETELQHLHGRLAGEEGATAASLASVLAEYNMLLSAEQIAAKVAERAALLLLDARNAANQQSVYLATFVRPDLPEASLYPVRWRVILETALISFVAWCLLQLIYHGVRDHID